MLYTTTVERNTLELLIELMQKPYLQGFNLVGGTSLSLQIGHRISIDLDLFTSELFDTNELKSNLEDDFPAFQVILESQNTLITTINDIKVDFIRFKYGFVYQIVFEDKIRLANLKDIASMKIDAITGRGKKKDFFDLFFLLERYSLSELLALYQEKYQHSTLFHVIKSLCYFDEAELEPDPIILDKRVNWVKVKSVISNEINQL